MGSSQVCTQGSPSQLPSRSSKSALNKKTHLGESTVVPDVTVVGEAVADVAETTLLDVLLDGVERLAGGDLHLRVGPAGDLDDHVEDARVLVGEEGDIVEGGDDGAILLEKDAVVCDVGARVSCTGTVTTRRGGSSPRVLGAPIRRGLYSVGVDESCQECSRARR